MRRFAIRRGYDYSKGEANAYRNWSGLCINIGAGSFSHPNWTNLDVSSDHYRKVQSAGFIEYDLTKNLPLPFEDYAVELVYCSHVIEHIKDDNAENLFREVFRVLRRGGLFRITCPNADLFYYAAKLDDFSAFGLRTNHWFSKFGIAPETVSPIDYLVRAVADQANPTKKVLRDANPAFYKEAEENFNSLPKEKFLNWLASKVEFSIEHVSSHINWWNLAKINFKLNESGFSVVIPSSFGASIAAPLRNTQKFDRTSLEESIYIDTIKF